MFYSVDFYHLGWSSVFSVLALSAVLCSLLLCRTLHRAVNMIFRKQNKAKNRKQTYLATWCHVFPAGVSWTGCLCPPKIHKWKIHLSMWMPLEIRSVWEQLALNDARRLEHHLIKKRGYQRAASLCVYSPMKALSTPWVIKLQEPWPWTFSAPD